MRYLLDTNVWVEIIRGNQREQVAVTRDLFAAILDRIALLAIPPPVVTGRVG